MRLFNFDKKSEEKPLQDADLKNWGAAHIVNALGPFWAMLGFDSEQKILDEIKEGLNGKPILKSIIRKAEIVIAEKDNGPLSYNTCLLNGSVITFFPKVKSKSVFPVVITEVREMGNLFEAFAEIKVGSATLIVFLTDYLINKEKYTKGAAVNLALGGIAFNGEPSDIQKKTFERDGKPLKVTKDFAGIFPNNPSLALYSAIGSVDNEKKFELHKENLGYFRMKIINQPNVFIDLIGLEKNIKFSSNKEQQLFCNFWIQANIAKE